MIKKFVKGKVYVFIDAANVFYAQRTLGWRISYERLMAYFKKECGVKTKCFLYTAFNDKNEGQQRFIKMLKKTGYVVRTKPVKRIRIAKGIYEWKGSLDIELSIDVLDNLERFDTLILVSGDSDFAPVLKRAKAHKKRVLVMSSKKHVSKELLDLAKYVNFRKLRSEIELRV